MELGRRLGVKQPTAWAVKHKIMAVMARREGETALSGRVEMDDAYLGGVRSGGKRGRGAAGKTPFVAAISTSPEGRPRKLKLAPVKGFRKREIARGAKHWLAPGAAVVTDGLGCWSALDEIACSHQAIRTGSGRQAARMAPFKWVNTTLGNIKCAITGTYRKLGPDHAGRYLASFAWRYNCCSACNFDPQCQATSIAYRANRRATHAPNNSLGKGEGADRGLRHVRNEGPAGANGLQSADRGERVDTGLESARPSKRGRHSGMR